MRIPQFPAHASPAFKPTSPRPEHASRSISDFNLDRSDASATAVPPPPALISPAFTPPSTPGADTPARPHRTKSVPVGEPTPDEATPKLLDVLPTVHCEVRARIPTTTGQEMFLHLYSNSADDKEHLAIVFGPHIRSRSLDAPRPGETEKDRMIRGAYTGRLYPGRLSSRVNEIRHEAGVSSSAPAPPSPQQQPFDQDFPSYPPDLAPPLVRIHSECYTGETVWSARCDCGEQLDEAARLMSLPDPSTPNADSTSSAARSAGGVIIYLRQEGRGIGLLSKLKA
ncbi:hypothetical protein LTR28_003201, partial [Elasticomyces elasticus]